MIYIIDGNEELFIRNKIKEICNQDDADIIKYDGNDKSFSINNMVNSCLGNSLFSNKTIVLVKDAYFLTNKVENEIDILLKYIKNPIYETDLIFYSLDNNHNSKLKTYKEISKNAQVLKYDSYDSKNFDSYLNQQINKYGLQIDHDAINHLNSLCKKNATLLEQNLIILSNYPGKINIDVVNSLCTTSDENNAFDFINALTNKDISKAIFIERKMLSNNDSAMQIVGLLAAQLRFLYQLAYYSFVGKNSNEIMELTGCSYGRYLNSMKTLSKINLNQIINLLAKLSDFEIKCKTDNSLSDNMRFELFILNLLRDNKEYASN